MLWLAQPTHDSQRNSHDSDDSAAPGAVMGISMMVTCRGAFYLSWVIVVWCAEDNEITVLRNIGVYWFLIMVSMICMCRLAGWTETTSQYSAGQLVTVLVALILLAT